MVAEIALVILLLLALLLALSMRLTAAAHRKDRIEAPSETTPLFKKGEELHGQLTIVLYIYCMCMIDIVCPHHDQVNLNSNCH